MNKVNSILAGGLCVVGLFSCQKEQEPQPVENIIPLRVGNEWTYRVYQYDGDGLIYDSTATYIRSVLRDTLINKSTWYILNDRSIVQNTAQGYAYYNVAGKQSLLVYPGSTMGGIGYGYKYPAYDLWVYTLSGSIPQPVPASKKNFVGNLFKVEYQFTYPGQTTAQIQKREDWIVPSIGLVRWDTFFRDSDQLQRRMELISYSLK
ncbi:hypothetical protein GCM10027346_23170 [Hymenobacter seoulensis]